MRMMKLHPSMNEIILYIYIKPTIYIYIYAISIYYKSTEKINILFIRHVAYI